MKVERVGSLVAKLNDLKRKAIDANASVVVGYTQHYGIFVHENLAANHPVGQAKYLEQPARQLAAELAHMIREAFKKKGSMEQALLLAGLRLQRESQLLVPVDTSALKASAYTALERDAANAAADALSRSDRIRESVLKARRKK